MFASLPVNSVSECVCQSEDVNSVYQWTVSTFINWLIILIIYNSRKPDKMWNDQSAKFGCIDFRFY